MCNLKAGFICKEQNWLMKELHIVLFIILFPFLVVAQYKPSKYREKSWQTLAFRITAAEAEQFMKWDSIPADNFASRQPDHIFSSDWLDTDTLPTGNYILLTADGSHLQASFICISNLMVLDINNKRSLQLDVRNKAGDFITGAKVFINDEPAPYNADSKTFWVKHQKTETPFVKVYAPGDTLYLNLQQKDDGYTPSLWSQRIRNIRSTRVFRWINWLPSKIARLFSSRYRYKPKRIGAAGFIIFNQPKYKPLDTVKYKGYVVNKRGKQYKKNIEVHLGYYHRQKNYDLLITALSPETPGAFTGQFLLSDSIPLDINCTLYFKTSDQKMIIQNSFKTEDYLLDEISSFQFRSGKNIYFRNDSLRFFASAKDANGLNVMDAKARLLLTTHTITAFYKDTVFVQDTIWNEELPLLTNGDTKFTIPASILPSADVSIDASLIFKNSNNELHTESTTVDYKYKSKEINAAQKEDSLHIVYMEDGMEKTNTGTFAWNDGSEQALSFPATIKIDPAAKDYTFYSSTPGDKSFISEDIEIKPDYRISLSRISSADTLGFVLYNPYRIPVYFTVFDGNNVIATGKESEAIIRWKKVMKNKKQAYKVRWQYIWAGTEQRGEETIGLLYKMLNLQISCNASVYPGQQDSIRVNVKDYMGKPAAGVNLTAVSYNNQFNKDIKVQEPPYLAKYKSKRSILRRGFENEDDEFTLTKRYLLGNNRSWIEKLHLDTMPYYQLLFPKENVHDAAFVINNFLPQVAVNMVQNGVPQEIYLLYINRQLVYYNGVTDRMNDAFEVYPDNVKIGIRLRDKYVEIDSLYLQPNYKHDLSFDLNHLPPHSSVVNTGKYWNMGEMNLLEQTMWMMQNDYRNNSAWLWQGSRLVHLSGDRQHIAGPFAKTTTTFFSPGNFDINFMFEPEYEYQLSKQVLRLEKKLLFPRKDLKNSLPDISNSRLLYGDTLLSAPPIVYPAPKKSIYLKITNEYEHNSYATALPGKGTLQFLKAKDSNYAYYILEPADTTNGRIIVQNTFIPLLKNINPGTYTLLLVTNNNYTTQFNDVLIRAGYSTCVKTNALLYSAENKLFSKITADNDEPEISTVAVTKEKPETVYSIPSNVIYTERNGSFITGKVFDAKGGNPIPGVSIVFKGSRTGTATDAGGSFILNNVRPGRYTLLIAAVGYVSTEMQINAKAYETLDLRIQLNVSSQSLQEVVVTGYGLAAKHKSSISITTISADRLELSNQLQGKVAGVNITSAFGAATTVLLRGMSSMADSGNDPLYVIDGILYEKAPKNLDSNNIQDISILKDAEATAMYGARAANGVVINTTKTTGLRTHFKDYALWKPNFFTDKNGEAVIPVQYPDNITGWKTYVVAMDKQLRIGKAHTTTQAYKPMLAGLSVPQFLIAGDSVSIIGKSKNYTADSYSISTSFTVNGNVAAGSEKQLNANDASIESMAIAAVESDTVKASFTLQSSTGFKDGEEKNIPVFPVGTEEAIGNFWLLQNDSSVSFMVAPGSQKLSIYAQNNTLQWMLEELEQLHKYPYYCMEQTASKLTGLALEKKIKDQLGQPFTRQKEFDRLLQKIQKAQLFDGGWAWWENGKTNFYISNYITNALLQFREVPLVENNIRNAFLFLQNQLPFLRRDELLSALFTLSNGKHEMNYVQWMNRINVDSLTLHQQWQWVSIQQQQHLHYEKQLKKLVDARTETMLGAAYWGVENYSWYSNEVATTVLAYQVIEKEAAYKYLCPLVTRYFLEKKQHGYWRNTVETASILNTILPGILAQLKNFLAPATLTVSGDTSFVISDFPYQLKRSGKNIKNIQFSKTGGGMLYLTAYQESFNPQPLPVQDRFIINSYFEKNNEKISNIKAGEKTTMVVLVNVLKDADYVQLEIPIPAGCTYASKNNDGNMYKEYFKNRLLMFKESFPKGTHRFEIALEPRYSGRFTLNPAKALLMYFPTFYGRNEIKKVTITE